MPLSFELSLFSLSWAVVVAQVESFRDAGDAVGAWTANNGLAVVLLFIAIAAALYATVRVTRWTGNNLLIPLKDAAISHLKNSDSSLTSISENMQEMSQQMREMRIDQSRLLKCHEDLTGRVHCQLKPPGTGNWQIGSPSGGDARHPDQGRPPTPSPGF